MENDYNKLGIFSGTTLKIIACFFMVIDHVGLTFFPEYDIFRILGRIAFPIFAFFIAEGSRYSRHKIRRFSLIFLIGLVFLLFYLIYDGELYGNIFLTFSISIILDQLLYSFKKAALDGVNKFDAVMRLLLFVAAFILTVGLYSLIRFEYGFFGTLLPVIINLTNFRGIDRDTPLKKLDQHYARLLLALIGMIPLSIYGLLGEMQFYCLLSIIPLLFYNGKVGNPRLKYAFYIFYPVHLIIIEGIAIILAYLQ
jgi:hypothetical protein